MKQGIDCIGNSVIYFCHDGKGNVLMAKRSMNARDEAGKWDIGGGGIDLGATIDETLRREIKEEYCAEVLSYEFLGYRDVHREHNGIKTHWIALDFKVLIDPSNVKIGEPHKFDDIGWFNLDALPKPKHSQWPEFLKKYWEKIKFPP
ncbi:MAG: NUDIX domain-containing protein, partial [Candidatus Doudnabacteria bacterium]|nr:NUDIX domain-containing protein [Candidatus Doudnabacteria bacterium]